MNEEWRTIDGTGGKYSVSNLGNVRRNEHYTIVKPNVLRNFEVSAFYKLRELKQYKSRDGYSVVRFFLEDGKFVTRKVHRLVASAFIQNPHNLDIVNHIDENKQNNCVSNLEWCDSKYNANHGTRNERLRKISGIKVAQYDLSGNLVKVWDSMTLASQSFGCTTTSTIRRVCKGQRRTYKGYVWKYVDAKVIGDVSLKEAALKDKQLLILTILDTFSREELYKILKLYDK